MRFDPFGIQRDVFWRIIVIVDRFFAVFRFRPAIEYIMITYGNGKGFIIEIEGFLQI